MGQKEWNKKFYEANKEKRLAITKAQKTATNLYIQSYKESNPCDDCKLFYPYYVMQFDHVRGEKELEVSKASKYGWSIARTQNEIDKCDLVCANCHSERSYQRINNTSVA